MVQVATPILRPVAGNPCRLGIARRCERAMTEGSHHEPDRRQDQGKPASPLIWVKRSSCSAATISPFRNRQAAQSR